MLPASVPVPAPELVERVRTPTPVWGLGKPSVLAFPWEKSAYAAPSGLILPGPGFGHAPQGHARGTPTRPRPPGHARPFPSPVSSTRFSPYRAFNEAEGSRSPRTDQSRARSQPSKEKVLTHHTGPVLWHMERWPGHCSRGRRGGAHSQQVRAVFAVPILGPAGPGGTQETLMGQLARQHMGVVRRLGEPGVCLLPGYSPGWVGMEGGLPQAPLWLCCPVLGAPPPLHTRDP